jgi:hypothetical protein
MLLFYIYIEPSFCICMPIFSSMNLYIQESSGFVYEQEKIVDHIIMMERGKLTLILSPSLSLLTDLLPSLKHIQEKCVRNLYCQTKFCCVSIADVLYFMYKVVQIWPGLVRLVYTQISPGHIWITLYIKQSDNEFVSII